MGAQQKGESSEDVDESFLDRMQSKLCAFRDWAVMSLEVVPDSIRRLIPVARPFELVILDAGLAIPLPKRDVDLLRSMGVATLYHDFEKTAEVIYAMAIDTSRCVDPAAFKHGIAETFRNVRKEV